MDNEEPLSSFGQRHPMFAERTLSEGVKFVSGLTIRRKRRKRKTIERHSVLKPVRNASHFLLLLDLEQFIRPLRACI